MLYGVGRGRDDASKNVKRICKDVIKLFNKKLSIDVSDGGKVKKHNKGNFYFEKLVQSCPNFTKFVQTWQTLSKLFSSSWWLQYLNYYDQSYAEGPNHESDLNLSKLVQTCPNFSKLIQTCENMSKLVNTFLYIFFLISRWCHIRTSCTKIPELVLLWSTLCQLSVWPNYDWNAFSFRQQQCKLFAIAWTCVFPVRLNQFVFEYPGNSGLVSSNSQRTAWGWRSTYWKKILSHQVTFFVMQRRNWVKMLQNIWKHKYFSILK